VKKKNTLGKEDVHPQNRLNRVILNWCIGGCWFTPTLGRSIADRKREDNRRERERKTLVLGLCYLPTSVGFVFRRFWWDRFVGWLAIRPCVARY
jgi:hypothetical protein